MTAEASAAGRTHVIGGGMAGLAAAVALAEKGVEVALYEAGPQAGGRCRSFFDRDLGVRIDNGNHLLLSGNTAALDYVARIGALGAFEIAPEAAIPFVDIASGGRWAVRPSQGRLPWWLFSADRRIPGTRARDYIAALRLGRCRPDDTVAAVLSSETALFRRLWQPLTVAALNTAAADASATLLWRILTETLGRGAGACRTVIARDGLSEGLVDPALALLAARGAAVRLGARLRAIGFAGDSIAGLSFDDGQIPLAPQDRVILAVPAAMAARLVPGLVVPDDYAPIVNAHFRHTAGADAPAVIGIVGGVAEWVFCKREVVSVTVSAADAIVDEPAEMLCETLWRDVAQALQLPAATPAPAGKIVKERRATFRATPAQLARRPVAATAWNNLHLAGDYVDTGLPATIEGAIRSGFAAAALVNSSGLRSTRARPLSPPAATRTTNVEDYQRALP
jgi:squalene-associated FAD-dependent desaturase